MKRKTKQNHILLSDRDRKVFVDTLMNPPAPSKRLIQAAKKATKHRLSERTRLDGDRLLKQATQELCILIQSAQNALKDALTLARRIHSMKLRPIGRGQAETIDNQLDHSLAQLTGRLSLSRPFEEMDATDVTKLARETFGSSQKASQWLNRPNRALKGRTPLSLLSSQAGVKRVRTILGRIEYGVYS